MATGCWNHLLLPPSSRCIFPLVTLSLPWCQILGFQVLFCLHCINSSPPTPITPTTPHSPSRPSHFVQSHTSTNKSSSSQTACNRQTLGWDTSRLECGSGLTEPPWRLDRSSGGQSCAFRLWWIRLRTFIFLNLSQFKFC